MRSLKASFIISVSLLNKKNIYIFYCFVLLFKERMKWKITKINVINFSSFVFISQLFSLKLQADYVSQKKKKSTKVSPVKVTAKAASFETRKIDVAQPNTDYVLKTTECKNV